MTKLYMLPVKYTEDYSGEHREWIKEYYLPDWLVKEIQDDVVATIVTWLRTHNDTIGGKQSFFRHFALVFANLIEDGEHLK